MAIFAQRGNGRPTPLQLLSFSVNLLTEVDADRVARDGDSGAICGLSVRLDLPRRCLSGRGSLFWSVVTKDRMLNKGAGNCSQAVQLMQSVAACVLCIRSGRFPQRAPPRAFLGFACASQHP